MRPPRLERKPEGLLPPVDAPRDDLIGDTALGRSRRILRQPGAPSENPLDGIVEKIQQVQNGADPNEKHHSLVVALWNLKLNHRRKR
jgi:hypothetical protein